VLIIGCGMIGLAVVAAAKALVPDCHITAIARYPQQVEAAKNLGAHEIIVNADPYRETSRITGGKLYEGIFNNRMILGGFDVVYDCVGSAKTLQDSLRWARASGAVVLAGISLKPLRLDLSPVWYQEVDLLGLYAHGMEEWDGGKRSTFDITVDLLKNGSISTEGIITHRFPLRRWREAVSTALNKSSGAIKVVFDYRSEIQDGITAESPALSDDSQ
jgi:threonine dehydrogenase-like Zn-dependent dehydrogenase